MARVTKRPPQTSEDSGFAVVKNVCVNSVFAVL